MVRLRLIPCSLTGQPTNSIQYLDGATTYQQTAKLMLLLNHRCKRSHVRRRAVPGKNGLHSKENSILDEHPESLVYVSGLIWKNVKKEHSHKSKGFSTIFFPSNHFKDIYVYTIYLYILLFHSV